MLGKLIKHEFKATYKLFLSVYVALIGMSLLSLLMITINSDSTLLGIFSGICGFGFSISIFATPIITIIYIGYRFYKNLFTDEGYLMFTLPVKKSSLIFSKYITSIVWVCGSAVAMTLSLLILIRGNRDITAFVSLLGEIFKGFYNALIENDPLVIYSMIFYTFGYVLYIVAFIFVAVAFGQLIIPKHKILGAILAYFVLQIVQDVITSFVIGGFHLSGNEISNTEVFPTSFVFVSGAMLLAFAAIWIFFTNLICKKKLNLV